MAIQVVPVMRARVNHNPRGSATTQVTMPAANPFEREVITIRPSNQRPQGLAGLGAEAPSFAESFAAAFSGGTPAVTKGGGTAAPAGGSTWGTVAGGVTRDLLTLGRTYLETEMAEDLAHAQAQALQAAGINQLPGQTPPATLPVGDPTAYAQAQAQAQAQAAQKPSAMSQAMPWVIGGAAVLALGYFALPMLKGGKKTTKRRRSRRRRR